MKEVQFSAAGAAHHPCGPCFGSWGFWAGSSFPGGACPAGLLLLLLSAPGSEDAFSLRPPPRPHPGTAGDSGGQSHCWFAFHLQRLLRRLKTPTLSTALKAQESIPSPRSTPGQISPVPSLQLFFRDLFPVFQYRVRFRSCVVRVSPTSVPSAVSSEEYCCWPSSRLGREDGSQSAARRSWSRGPGQQGMWVWLSLGERPFGADRKGETGGHPTWSCVFPKSEPQAISPAEMAMWGSSVWAGSLGWGSLLGDSL